ncbi:MAG: radical SAM protein [Candidatus Aminicenantia bacterium]
MELAIYREIKRIAVFRTVSSPQKIAWNFIKYNFPRPFSKPFLPRAMCIYVTYRCNMRCKMCGIWIQNSKYQSNELSLEEFDKILSDPLFSKLEFININGGEPNLRRDLVEIVKMFINKFPHLKTITLNTNGIPPEKTMENVEKISTLCQRNKIRFSVSISLHKIGKEYDKIAGIKNAYPKVREAFNGLKKINQNNKFYISANCVITNLNLFSLGKMLKWGAEEHIPINFTLGEIRDRFNNLDMKDNIEIKDENKDFLIKFLRILAKDKSLFNHHAFRYKVLADMIEFNKERNISCHYAIGGLILGSEGSLFYCKDSKSIGNCRDQSAYSIYYDKKNLEDRGKKLLKGKCKKCPPNTFNRIEIEKDIIRYLIFLFKKKKI